MALPDAAEAVLRRNRGIQAAKDIRECKEAQLNLSNRGLGDEGAKELAEELKVSELVHWELFVVVRFFVVLRNFRDVPVTSPKARSVLFLECYACPWCYSFLVTQRFCSI